MTTFSTSRQFAASPAAVFGAIQDAERLAKWWGPDGTAYPNESVFTAIEVNRKVVIQHVNHPHFQLSITLEAAAGVTLLRWDQTFADAAVAQSVRHIVEPANEQNLDRLGVELGLAKPST